MKTCVDCGSNNVVKNLNTYKIFCFDCKSERIYRVCYECKEIIKEEPFDGSDWWHHNNQRYKMPDGEMVSCSKWKHFNDVCDEECT